MCVARMRTMKLRWCGCPHASRQSVFQGSDISQMTRVHLGEGASRYQLLMEQLGTNNYVLARLQSASNKNLCLASLNKPCECWCQIKFTS